MNRPERQNTTEWPTPPVQSHFNAGLRACKAFSAGLNILRKGWGVVWFSYFCKYINKNTLYSLFRSCHIKATFVLLSVLYITVEFFLSDQISASLCCQV